MTRMCDFCDKSEHEVSKMAEVKPEERIRKELGASHICLDCARIAVSAMEESMATIPGVGE